MFSLFRQSRLLSPEDHQFQIDTFAWLLKYFGGDDFYNGTILVLPTKAHFPSEVNSESEAAEATFKAVKKYCGLENWPCRLDMQAQDTDPKVAPAMSIQNVPANPLGTFSLSDEQQAVITYNPSLVSNPQQMVATFAHELAHYLTITAKEPPPGGWENWEFATDIAATFLGFGVFMANNAFSFSQFSDVDAQGWKSSRNGYLSEVEHCFALGVFLALKQIDIEEASKYLKPNLRKLLIKASKEIQRDGVIKRLLEVKYLGPKAE